MLAALSRRVSRMFVGLTMVTALSVGLCLAPVLAVSAPAEAVENSSNDVNVNIFPTSGSSVNDGEELAVTVSLVNNSTDTVAAGQIVVTTGSAVISDATTLNNWLAKTDGEQQPGRWLGVIKAPALAAGAHVDLTTTLPLNNALYGSAWGPRGLAADLEVSGESVSSGRGVLIWATASAPSAAKLVTVFPVVSPASTSGLLSADELTLLTSPQGVLTSQLAVAGGRNVTLAVDPRIVASIDALGNGAPASATAWLARLKALPNESFSLAYADADVALQSQAGATQLATANFADQPLIVEPSGVAPTVTPVAPLADLAWAPTLSGFTWPGEDTVVASDMGVLSTNGTQFTLLSSSNVAAGANSPARASIGDQQALITNAGLSRSMRNASSSLNDAQWAANFSLASAYLATTALSPGTQGVEIGRAHV